ncbi:MAG: PA0069 family radical SAM protein [Cytophagaceae bacterium]
MSVNEEYKKGRGAQYNKANPYQEHSYSFDHPEGLDEPFSDSSVNTKFYIETPKQIVNKLNSPDIGMAYSLNAYQGCEHGCIYCYARNSHQYWGFSAGIDFESKIIVKENAPDLLEKFLKNPKWEAFPIVLSGNTDCYQPAEKKFGLTRRMLELFLKYQHPVSIITKNSLILRDLDLLEELDKLSLVHVSLSITSLDEKLRQKLEPRTSTSANRLKTVNILSGKGIPVHIMAAPVIPGLNDHEIPEILKRSADNGASGAGYTMIRLNGSIGDIFTDWINKTFPDKASKVLHQIRECHNGKLNDSRYGTRMKGEGKVAETINQLFKLSYKKYFKGRKMKEQNLNIYKKPGGCQLDIFK